jgi:hypothetical protein
MPPDDAAEARGTEAHPNPRHRPSHVERYAAHVPSEFLQPITAQFLVNRAVANHTIGGNSSPHTAVKPLFTVELWTGEICEASFHVLKGNELSNSRRPQRCRRQKREWSVATRASCLSATLTNLSGEFMQKMQNPIHFMRDSQRGGFGLRTKTAISLSD